MSENETSTRLAILERDVHQISGVFDKLDTTMDKLTEISSSIKEMLAIHNMRLDKNEFNIDKIFDLLEKRRMLSDEQHKTIQSKIEETEKELKEDMNDLKSSFILEIKELRNDLHTYNENNSKALGMIEKLKWSISVIGVLIVFILYKLDVIPFSLFIPR